MVLHQDAPLYNTQLKECIQIPAIQEKPRKEMTIVKTVQRNAYFTHTDQLLDMCVDEDVTVREKTVSMIRKIRKEIQQMEECTDRYDEEVEDSAATGALLKYTKKDSEDGYVVNMRKLVTPKLKCHAKKTIIP